MNQGIVKIILAIIGVSVVYFENKGTDKSSPSIFLQIFGMTAVVISIFIEIVVTLYLVITQAIYGIRKWR